MWQYSEVIRFEVLWAIVLFCPPCCRNTGHWQVTGESQALTFPGRKTFAGHSGVLFLSPGSLHSNFQLILQPRPSTSGKKGKTCFPEGIEKAGPTVTHVTSTVLKTRQVGSLLGELQLVWLIEPGALMENGRHVLITNWKKERKEKQWREKRGSCQSRPGLEPMPAGWSTVNPCLSPDSWG